MTSRHAWLRGVLLVTTGWLLVVAGGCESDPSAPVQTKVASKPPGPPKAPPPKAPAAPTAPAANNEPAAGETPSAPPSPSTNITPPDQANVPATRGSDTQPAAAAPSRPGNKFVPPRPAIASQGSGQGKSGGGGGGAGAETPRASGGKSGKFGPPRPAMASSGVGKTDGRKASAPAASNQGGKANSGKFRPPRPAIASQGSGTEKKNSADEETRILVNISGATAQVADGKGTFHLDYAFANARPSATAKYVWIIETGAGQPIEQSVTLEAKGSLQQELADVAAGPYQCYLAVLSRDGQKRPISEKVAMN
jgi:hypothetical protein